MTWAEQHLRQVITGQARWGTINPLIASSFYRDYPFSMMAADEAAASGREAPVVAAVWSVARSGGGGWWPFANSVGISDRPAEIHLNKEYLLHCEGGPAAVFAMGRKCGLGTATR
jgi:hypothetical protein